MHLCLILEHSSLAIFHLFTPTKNVVDTYIIISYYILLLYEENIPLFGKWSGEPKNACRIHEKHCSALIGLPQLNYRSHKCTERS